MYLSITSQDELRQGDLFLELPWLLFDPTNTGSRSGPLNIAQAGFASATKLLIDAAPAPGIIVSADCDCAGGNQHLIACRVSDIKNAKGLDDFHSKELGGKRGKVKAKLELQRKQGVYYLCSVPASDFLDSYVDLNNIQIFSRQFLLEYRTRRIATLTEEARHHLREKMAAYHTRFGPDERYFLTDEEKEIATREALLR